MEHGARNTDAAPGADSPDLELIPRPVRDKLDRVGIKLHLREWQAMPLADRVRLRDLPCSTDADAAEYAAAVDHLVRRITGAPAQRLGSR